jgi:hypothetical protein
VSLGQRTLSVLPPPGARGINNRRPASIRSARMKSVASFFMTSQINVSEASGDRAAMS